MSIPSWTSPRASARTLPISRVIALASRSLCWAMSAPKAYRISPRLGAGVLRHIGKAVSAALIAIATSAFVPCWKIPTTSRVSAGLRLSNVVPEVESHHSPAMKWRNVGVSTAVSVMSTSVVRASDALDGHRDRSSAAEAEGGKPVAPLASGQLVEEPGHDPGAAGTDRVAEGDGAAVDVDLVPVEAELATVGQRLRGERLVDLDQVERLDRHLDPIEEPSDALDRGEEEPFWRDLGLGIADDPGERRQAMPFDGALRGDDRCRGAIGDARRVPGRDGAHRRVAAVVAVGKVEDGLEPRERFRGRVAART